MHQKICGSCSQKYEFSLEKRIDIALSRVINRIYTCSVCSKEHVQIKFPLSMKPFHFPEPSFDQPEVEQLELFGVYEHVKSIKNAFELGTRLDLKV